MIDKKFLRQEKLFSQRLPYEDQKIKEICFSLMNIYLTKDIIKQLHNWEGKSKLKFIKEYTNYYDEMKNLRQNGDFMFEENPFSENLEGIGIIMNEALFLLKFFQTKSQPKKNIKYFDLYYTLILILLGGGKWDFR